MILLKIILLFFCYFRTLWALQTIKRPDETFDSNATTSRIRKINYYDADGILTLDGSVPGVSKAIVLDFKQYYIACGANVYFTFLFTANLNKSDEHGIVCEEGITICYEGQLMQNFVMPEFLVPNINGSSLAVNCAIANDYRRYVRGLNVAVQKFEIANTKAIVGSSFEIPMETFQHFFVISVSFIKESYYIPIPKDGTIVLKIGDTKSLLTKVLDTEGHEIQPVSFTTINGTEYGSRSFGTPSDTENNQRFADAIGLWMLYMDFKSQPQAWQIFNTIHTDAHCQLMAQVRGNRMSPCRTYMEDIMVTEPMPIPFDLTYTKEVGIVQKNEIGREETNELVKTAKQAEQDRNTWKASKSEIDQQIESESDKQIDRNETVKEHVQQSNYAFSGGIRAHSNPDIAGDLTRKAKDLGEQSWNIASDGEIGIGQIGNFGPGGEEGAAGLTGELAGKVNKGSSKSDKETWIHEEMNTKIQRTTMFSEVTRSQAMMEAFKSTSGLSSTMSNSLFQSTTNAFSTRESIDIIVENIQPGKKLVIKQMIFECDGNVVKLPIVYMTDGVEKIEFGKEVESEKLADASALNWNNQTSGMAKAGFFLFHINATKSVTNTDTMDGTKTMTIDSTTVTMPVQKAPTQQNEVPSLENTDEMADTKKMGKDEDDDDPYEDIIGLEG